MPLASKPPNADGELTNGIHSPDADGHDSDADSSDDQATSPIQNGVSTTDATKDDSTANHADPLAVQHYASIYPGKERFVPESLVQTIRALEEDLGMPVWLLIQSGEVSIDPVLYQHFFMQRHAMARGEPIALLIDSPGGYAISAYQIASLLNRHCGRFTAIVPRYAKSAATLLTLGAETIIMGEHAELGPLDVQIFDSDYEGYRSGLNEVQALERLHASALEAVDRSVLAWRVRSGKKIDTILPVACHFVAELMRPLFDKIDTVNYTQRSRELKEAEEYAVRLLENHLPDDEAREVARALVEQYPDHSFSIDVAEASNLGLQQVTMASPEQSRLFDQLHSTLLSRTVIGQIKESTPDETS